MKKSNHNKKQKKFVITSNGPNRKFNSTKYKNLSKCVLSHCKGDNNLFEFINFRGSHLSKCNFNKSNIHGCDFWGATFNKCKFKGAVIDNCVFQGCIFRNCDFTDALIKKTIFVNTNLTDCKNLNINNGSSNQILNHYPNSQISIELQSKLIKLKKSKTTGFVRTIWINENKINKLNFYLLLQHYSDFELCCYFQKIILENNKNNFITYGALINKFLLLRKSCTLNKSCPTQSRDCVANGLGNKDWGL